MTFGTIFYDAVNLAFRLYQIMIVIRAFMTWLPIDQSSRIVTFIGDLTDPFFRLIERFMPAAFLAPLNFTPLIAYMLVAFARITVNQILLQLIYGVSSL